MASTTCRCSCSTVPTELADGAWTPQKRQAFGKTVIDAIARHSPDFKDLILHAEIRTPWDIENEVGLTEGNIFQGELTFDQLLFNRPLPGYAQYRAPLRGMYMCGSSTHPGGGVMGAPGANCRRRDPARSRTAHRSVSPQLRQHRHRRRPQRPRVRHLSGARRPQRAAARGRGPPWAGRPSTREFAPGFRVSACAHLLHLMPRRPDARSAAVGSTD